MSPPKITEPCTRYIVTILEVPTLVGMFNEFLTMSLYCLRFVEIELGGDGGLAIVQFIRNSA